MLINVKGEDKHIAHGAVSYDDVVELSGLRRHRQPTVTWRRPDGMSGTLSPGQFVTPEERMVFNVAYTGGT